MMETVRRPLGYLMIVLGALVALQFLAFAFYPDINVGFREFLWRIIGDGSEGVSGIAVGFRVWLLINYTTMLGSVLALVVAYVRWRNYDRSDVREAIATGAMFIFAGAYAIMFFEQKFTSLFALEMDDNLAGYRAVGWIILDITWPVLAAWVASYLLRTERE